MKMVLFVFILVKLTLRRFPTVLASDFERTALRLKLGTSSMESSQDLDGKYFSIMWQLKADF